MRLHRFYINTPLEHTKTQVRDESLIHQWRNVFRYNVASEVILFDGSGQEYDAVIEHLSNREATVRLVRERKGVVPEKNITLLISLIKKDKLEWIVEKATELGVSKIVPIISERSEKKGFNIGRARKIMIEAAEQCGRADVPEIGQIMNLEACIMNYAENALVMDPSAAPVHNSHFITHNSLSIFVGPEGGWTEKEIERFKEAKMEIFSLGKLTLRTETAAIAALTVLGLLG